MNCRHFELLIQKYHDGELDGAERAAYENHRDSCPSCRAQDARFAAVFGALDGMPLAEPSPLFDAGVMAAVDVARYRKSPADRASAALRRRWNAVPFRARVAAGVAAAFGLFVAVYTPMIWAMAEAAGKIAALAASGLYVARRAIEDPSAVSRYLDTSTNYRLAARILLATLEKQVSGIQVSHIALAGVSVVIFVILAVKATRVAWRKGETHVSII